MSLRLIVAMVLIAGTQVALSQFDRQSRRDARRANRLDATQLPMEFEGWTGTEPKSEPDALQTAGALTIVSRLYQSANGRTVEVLVCTFPAGDDVLPHPPDLCYRGAGWNVLGETWEASRGGRRYKLMPVEHTEQKALVIYWYQLGTDVVSHRGELRNVLQRTRWEGKAWPPLVKVLLHAPVDYGPREVQNAMEELGDQIYDWVLAVSSTTTSADVNP